MIAELEKRKKAIIITERKEHIDTLNQFLKQSYETVTLSGDDSESSRRSKWELLKKGNYQVLITTGQLFGEGSDLQTASSLFLAYPFSFKGKLIQYIGRVQRSELTPTIYDYRDKEIEYLDKLFLKRNMYYRHLDRQASLFDDAHKPRKDENTFVYEKELKIAIGELDLRYGAVGIKIPISELQVELDFEIEHDDMRPEFEVLKPYFSKFLGSKFVRIECRAEFQNREIIAQAATSVDLEKINQEVVEGIRFRFIDRNLLRRKRLSDEEDLHNVEGLLETQSGSLFQSNTDLLNEILSNKQVKHYRQLRYLASRHEGTTLKLRFVLSPFSFVFLIKGIEMYHIILETLDTEEATYIWHVGSNRSVLTQKLNDIENDLSIIRNKGRQAFLDSNPVNFGRVLHDYTDERKGFVIWKGMLEERLV